MRDEIYLAETEINPWWTWVMKRDDAHWPTVGMLQWNESLYEPDKLPTQGMPKSYRSALQLDKLYQSNLPGWTPSTFEVEELTDLTQYSSPKKP